MKKMKKFFAMLMAMIMIMGMSVTTFAAQGTPGVAHKDDTTTVSVSNISGGATVTLYRIAKGVYGESGTGLIRYDAEEGLTELSEKPTSGQINAIYQEVLKNPSKYQVETSQPIGTVTTNADGTVTSTTGTYTSGALHAGAYLAIISGAGDDSVYNPVLLTVSYDKDGNLPTSGTVVDVKEGYLYGSSAVAKKSEPNVDKEIVGGTTPDEERETASVGDVITYQIRPTMPSYPESATNKTFFFSDTMTEGLTFVFDSLVISFEEDGEKEIAATNNTDGTVTFTTSREGETVEIATARAKVTDGATVGFYLNFNYDALVYNENPTMIPDDVDGMMVQEVQNVYTPVITYQAVLNDKAVVGGNGNSNDAKMYYAHEPNNGSTFEPTTDQPEPTPGPDGEIPGINIKEDEEIVYTYELAFLKTGEGDDADKLADAVFGIYTDQDCSILVDVVKTNSDGYAVSSKVKAGTYYIKELVAPTGYTLNDTVYSINATWKTATSTITSTRTEWKYTTTQPDEWTKQIGWIDTKGTEDTADDVFYAMDEFGTVDDDVDNMGVIAAPTGVRPDNMKPAYAVYDKTNVTTSGTITTNQEGAGTAAALFDTASKDSVGSIPNTRLATLPSTGGIGTTIFTIGGCAIMILAAGLYFASRRKSAR